MERDEIELDRRDVLKGIGATALSGSVLASPVSASRDIAMKDVSFDVRDRPERRLLYDARMKVDGGTGQYGYLGGFVALYDRGRQVKYKTVGTLENRTRTWKGLKGELSLEDVPDNRSYIAVAGLILYDFFSDRRVGLHSGIHTFALER